MKKVNNSAAKIVAEVVWCAVAAGCVADEVKSPAVPSETMQAKKQIQFKIMTGDQYPLCHDYVDMLNKAQYTEIPVCERKIMPEFDKFKSVQWTEIADKEEIRKLVKEAIRLRMTWSEEKNRKNIEEFIEVEERKMNAGEYQRVFMASIDMDHDGKKETVYQFVRQNPELSKLGSCTEIKTYLVDFDEDTQNLESRYKKFVWLWSLISELGDNERLFYYDNRVYKDYPIAIGSPKQQIRVHEISGQYPTCSINIMK